MYAKMISRYPQITLLMMAGLAACAIPATWDWRAAEESDTTSGYSSFLEKHPRSEFAPEARSRIERIERERTENRNRIGKVLKYSSSAVTELEFLDNWNGKDPFFSKLGIIGIQRSEAGALYTLGIWPKGSRVEFVGIVDYFKRGDRVTEQLIGADFSQYTGDTAGLAEEFDSFFQGYRNRIRAGNKAGFSVKEHGALVVCWLTFGNDGKMRNMNCPGRSDYE